MLSNLHKGINILFMTTRPKSNNAERFALALEQAEMKGAELARRLGIDNEQNITNWKSRGVPSARLSAVALALGVSRDWLETGHGNMHGKPKGSAFAEERASYALAPLHPWDNETPLDDDEVALPLYKEVELASGNGRTAVQEVPGRKLRFSYATLRECGVLPDNAFFATNSGHSNHPLILHGATLGIDKGMTQIVDGEIYALDHDGLLRVKILERLPGNGLRMHSYNSTEFPPEDFSIEKILEQRIIVLGRVFWWSTIRPMKSGPLI